MKNIVILLSLFTLSFANAQKCDQALIYKILNVHVKALDSTCKQPHYILNTTIQIADYSYDTIYHIDECKDLKFWEVKKIESKKAIIETDDTIKDHKNLPYPMYYVSKPYFNNKKTECRVTTQVFTGHYLGFRAEYYYTKRKGNWVLKSSKTLKKAY